MATGKAVARPERGRECTGSKRCLPLDRGRYFVVHDTRQAPARHRRRHLHARVVGVVGSNGKTTTKELIGLLSGIARPNAAVITSIGEEHLERLANMDGVLEEETAILGGLDAEGLALVAEEPELLAERVRQILSPERVRVAGFSEATDFRPDGGDQGVHIQPDGTTLWRWRGAPVQLPLPGRWNVRNALLALGLAESWGVDAYFRIWPISRPECGRKWGAGAACQAAGRTDALQECQPARRYEETCFDTG